MKDHASWVASLYTKFVLGSKCRKDLFPVDKPLPLYIANVLILTFVPETPDQMIHNLGSHTQKKVLILWNRGKSQHYSWGLWRHVHDIPISHVLISDTLPKDLHASIFEEQKKVTQQNCRYSLKYPNRRTLMPFPGSSMGISWVHKKGKGLHLLKGY